ncbi:MAG: phosphatidylglycerophosphatase A [Alphaproteobacteria bacterium]|nr:phosphatidylglycerophosphatase A [Alphaproteobacteria bacterium]
MNSKLANIIATYFGLGLSKYAPGTVGSLGTLPLVFVLIYFGGFIALLVVAVILFFIGVKATDIVIKESQNEDPSKVVIDEVVGQLLSFSFLSFLAPEYLTETSGILYYVLGFVFFRFFDILKMGPVKYADTKIKNAYGVMLDDVFAGIFASILLLGVLFFIVNR